MTREEQLEQFNRELEELVRQYKDAPRLDFGPFKPFELMTQLMTMFEAKDSPFGPV